MARVRTAASVVACLGDSLTFGALTPEILHPWTDLLAADLPPHVTTANFGKNSDVLADMTTRYELAIKGQGYSAVHLLAPVNDIQAETPAATIWAEMEALVDDMLADGLIVILGVTSPAAGFATWNSTKQSILLAVRALMLAKAGVTHVDYYTLMGQPGAPTYLAEAYAYEDGLHYGPGGARFIANHLRPIVLNLIPAPIVIQSSPVGSLG